MRTIGTLIFPGFELLDAFGPLQMFGMMKDRYAIRLVAASQSPVTSNQAVALNPDRLIEDSDEFDILLVPGGMGTRREVDNSRLIDWIAETSEKCEFTLGVCTGSALLARSGVLDGRRATTNKAAFRWVAEQGPNVLWQKKARWVEDGPFITSSGVSAGIDMALAAIALMQGEDVAENVATACEYNWQKDPDLDPYAEIHGLV